MSAMIGIKNGNRGQIAEVTHHIMATAVVVVAV